jgi:hypothetical protein
MVLFNIYYLNDKKMKIKITEDQFKRLVENKLNGKPINEGVFDILGKIAKYALGGAAISFILKKIMDKFKGKEPTKDEVEKEIEKVAKSESLETNSEDKNIIIGDSQVPYIDMNTEKAGRISAKGGEESLWLGGVGLSWLKNAVKKYKTDNTVKNVIISIGTNGGFNTNEDISDLFDNLKKTFPKANFYVVQGSWGWGGNKDVTQSEVDRYYKVFKNQGATIIEPAIGKVSDPHNNLPVYKEIGKKIDSKL